MKTITMGFGLFAIAMAGCSAGDASLGWGMSSESLLSVEGAHGGRPFTTLLTGAQEAPGPGDPDGSGVASLTLNQGLQEVCFEIEVADISTPTAAHIHIAPAGAPGPVVVSFDVPSNGLDGCVAADPELIQAIRQNPAGYYVNVHNVDFPAGAVRGQLSK